MIYRLPRWLAFQGEDELLDESHTIIYIYIIWLKAMCICKLDTGTCSNWSDSKNIIEYRLIFGSRHVCFIYPPWNQYSAWTWMVGILVSFLGWPIFRGELLVSGSVGSHITHWSLNWSKNWGSFKRGSPAPGVHGKFHWIHPRDVQIFTDVLELPTLCMIRFNDKKR